MKQFLSVSRKLSSKGQWNSLFFSVFLSFLFTGFFTTVKSQTCNDNFTIEATRTYNAGTNTTTFTYKVTQTGAKNALSNFSLPLSECSASGPGIDISAALQGHIAEKSDNGTTWTKASTSYGKNPSAESCYAGSVFKFDDGSKGKIIWFRLILYGSWALSPDFAIIKYGNACCTIDVAGGDCLAESCLPIQPGTLSSSAVCAPLMGTVSLSNTTLGVKYQLVNTNGTASTADDVNVQAPKDGNNGTLSWTGLAAGTYYVKLYRVPADDCSTVTAQTTVVIHPALSVTANDASICTGLTVQLTASPAGGVWSGANVSASGMFNGAGLTAGTYVVSYSYSNPQTGCSGSDQATVTVSVGTTATDPSDAVRCVGGASVTFTTTAGGAGPFTYQWSKGGTPIAGATSASYTVSGPVTMAHAGTYSVTVTGACGTATQSATLTVGAAPVISCIATFAGNIAQMNVILSGNADSDPTHYSYAWTEDGAGSYNFSNIKNPVYTASVLDAGAVITFRVTVTNLSTGCSTTSVCSVTGSSAGSCPVVAVPGVCTGSTNTYNAARAPSANEIWKWTVNNGASIVGAANGKAVTVKAGAQSFTLTLTISYTNTAISATVCQTEVAVNACVPICSYTQGFWGNKNGLALLQSFLNSPITIGRPGQSVTIPAGSYVKLNSIMPGGGTPTGLRAGDCSILDPCFSSYLTQQGRINNNLLSQTIGVALAIQLNGTRLSGLAIGSGCIVTSGGTFQINQNVVNYLGGTATIQDLLNLANDVLGGVKMPGVGGVPSYSNLNSAMDAINNGFDECRTFVGYCEPTVVTSASPATLRISAYPNPFVDKVSFTIVSPVSGQASLEIYNLAGSKIQAVYEGYLRAGRTQVVEFRPRSTMVAGTLIYKLTVGGKQVTGKLINYKQ